MPKRKPSGTIRSERGAPGSGGAASPDDDWSKLSQRERFIRTARELGCDEGGEEFERAFSRAFPPRTPGQPVPSYAAAETPPKGGRRKPREPDQPTAPDPETLADPAERAKDAMRKADERARRTKRPGASGIRGGTSKD